MSQSAMEKQKQMFHVRRVQSKFLIGFADLEDPVTQMIRETNKIVGRTADKVGELQKDIIEHR